MHLFHITSKIRNPLNRFKFSTLSFISRKSQIPNQNVCLSASPTLLKTPRYYGYHASTPISTSIKKRSYNAFSTFSSGKGREHVYEEADINAPASAKAQEYAKAELAGVTGTDYAYKHLLERLNDAKMVCQRLMKENLAAEGENDGGDASIIEAMRNVSSIQWEAGMLEDAQKSEEDILSRLIKMHSSPTMKDADEENGDDDDENGNGNKNIPQHMDIAITMHTIGSIQSRLNNPNEAEKWFNAALEMKKKLFPVSSYHFEIGKSLNGLALTQIQKNQIEDEDEDMDVNGAIDPVNIIELLQQAEDHYVFHADEGGGGEAHQDMGDHPHVAMINRNMANLYRKYEDYRMAVQKYEQAIRINLLWASPEELELDGSEVIMDLLIDVADCLKALEDYDKALEKYEEALSMYKLIVRREKRMMELEVGENRDVQQADENEEGTPMEAILRHNIGMLHARLGRHENAMEEYELALKIKRGFGETHPEVAITLNGIGALLAAKGDGQGALSHFREALSIYRENTMVVGVDEENMDIDIAQTKKNIELVENRIFGFGRSEEDKNRRGRGTV